jgi:hypothetical protein
MKKIIFTFLITFSITSLFSQDLIVTRKGDSLNCKITKMDSTTIYFDIIDKRSDESISTFLSLNETSAFQTKYFQTNTTPNQNLSAPKNYPRFRLGISGGYSYRTAKAENDMGSAMESYLEDLKSGTHIGGDFTYYYSENSGIGLKYLSSNASSTYDGNITLTLPDASTISGPLRDNITVKYIGPYFSWRMLSSNNNNSFFVNAGCGYMGYIDKTVIIEDFIIKGATFGTCLDIGYDIDLGEGTALGFQISYLSGYLKEATITDGTTTQTIKLEEDSYEGLHRFDFSIGLRVNLE